MKTFQLIAFIIVLMAIGRPVAADPTVTEQQGLAALAAAGENLARQPAKKLFGAARVPAALPPKVYGSYAKGCIAGAVELPYNGAAWQIMRPSRNRNWGHPELVALVERLGREARQNDGWNGLLVGDIAQPRGGPMLSGHASHQVGLDADIWLTAMPDRELTRQERESISAVSVVKDRQTMNEKVWTEAHARLIQRAARYPDVARIFVHPPIKAELCKWATGDRSWLAKVRPYFGHNYHFHIRMKCPQGMASCKNQAPAAPKDGTGCGEELAYWMGPIPWTPKKRDPSKPPVKIKPAPPLTLAALPAECRAVVTAP